MGPLFRALLDHGIDLAVAVAMSAPSVPLRFLFGMSAKAQIGETFIRTKGDFWLPSSATWSCAPSLAAEARANGFALPCPDPRIGPSTRPGGVATIDDGADRWARADISRFEMVSKRRDRTAVVPTSYRSDASIAQLTDNFSLEPVRAASERVSEFRKTCRARPKTENSNEKTMAYSANTLLINRP
jgi:hypothetical protein